MANGMTFEATSTYSFGQIIFRWVCELPLHSNNMETQDLQKYQQVQAFLSYVRGANSRQDFMSKCHEFDSRFTEQYSAPVIQQKQKSVEKLPPVQEKPRNPFKTHFDETPRMQMTQQVNTPIHAVASPFSQNNHAPRPNYSRSEQQFFRPTPQPQAPTPRQQPTRQDQMNHTGMGVLNYNAFSQREYDDLKEQFFRPPNVPRPEPPSHKQWEGPSGLRPNDNSFNFNQMNMGLGMSSSSEIIEPVPRPPSRTNPFARQ